MPPPPLFLLLTFLHHSNPRLLHLLQPPPSSLHRIPIPTRPIIKKQHSPFPPIQNHIDYIPKAGNETFYQLPYMRTKGPNQSLKEPIKV